MSMTNVAQMKVYNLCLPAFKAALAHAKHNYDAHPAVLHIRLPGSTIPGDSEQIDSCNRNTSCCAV